MNGLAKWQDSILNKSSEKKTSMLDGHKSVLYQNIHSYPNDLDVKAILNLHKEEEENRKTRSNKVIFDSSSAICETYMARAYFQKLI